MTYAWLVRGLDGKERKKLDDELYGWGAMNERATQRLTARMAEDDTSGGES